MWPLLLFVLESMKIVKAKKKAPKHAEREAYDNYEDMDARPKRVKMSKKARAKVDADVEKEVKKLQKRYGADSVVPLTGTRAERVDAIPSGFQEFDDILTGESDDDTNATVEGTGIGFPRGRIIEIKGPESSGKTTLTLHMVVAAQRHTKRWVSFIDAEHALDPTYAAKLGVRLKRILISQPDSAEQGLDILLEQAKSGLFPIIVVDSVAGLVPQIEIDKKSVGDTVVGAQARLMSRMLRKLIGICRKTGTTVIFTNQIRMKIGVRFGNPETTPGGNALKFYASVRLDIRVVKSLKKNGHKNGHRARIRADKNKVAPPFREVYADIMPNRGIIRMHGDPGFGQKKGKKEADGEDDNG